MLLNEIGRGKSEIAESIVTTSPDVTVSTNLGPWVNRRGTNVFAFAVVANLMPEDVLVAGLVGTVIELEASALLRLIDAPAR